MKTRQLAIGASATALMAKLSSSFLIPRGQLCRRQVPAPVSDPTERRVALWASSPGNIQRPENEFSRTYRTETVLSGGGRSGRDYRTAIEATNEELEALAERFHLSEFSRLEADVVLRRDYQQSYGTKCIQVEGTVKATLCQKCVRTNEHFDVNLEFDIIAVVRPAESAMEATDGGNDDAETMAEIERQLSRQGGGGGGSGRRKKGGKKKKRLKSIRPDNAFDEMGLKPIQDMLQDFELEDDVIEDEAVMGSDGMLDVGELVAQLFRLKLDPYPKKPGSKPINISFSG